ncbi:MAG: sulfatase-like hydrolase/transferase, partial [Planctomycetota bacterium]
MGNDPSRDTLSRRDVLGRGAAAAASAAASPLLAGSGDSADRPNVLFISVDDLRPQLNCYGREQMVTPNLDRLADRGVVFERAYCQAPICGASRCSLLSGCRPDTTGIHKYYGRISEAMPDVLTLPQHFRNYGYTTASLGKVYHHVDDDPEGWSKKPWAPDSYLKYMSERGKRLNARPNQRGPAYESPDVPDDAYLDGV